MLAGLGSAAPSTTESFADDTHSTYRGRALAVVRGTGEAGTVTISATSTRHGSASLQLEVAASAERLVLGPNPLHDTPSEDSTMTDARHLDTALPIAERVEHLLSAMTLEEKAGQLSQYFYFGGFGEVPADLDIDALPPEQQAFIRQPQMVEAAIASGGAGSALFVKDAATANRLQRMAVEKTRLGIPLIFGYDVIHGLRTIFPVPIAQAASWDPAAIEAGQAVAAREARAAGIHWTFAPMVDIARDPRWGRIIEGAGEDPYLGCGGRCGAGARLPGRPRPRERPRRAEALRRVRRRARRPRLRRGRDLRLRAAQRLLPAVPGGVEAGAANVMSAYMDLNGVPASGNSWLLTEVLRDELGFDGFVVSDANAVKNLETQHFAASATDAAARAVSAGLDMEMCMFDPAYGTLPDAVAQGRVDESVIDTAVRRVLTAKFRLGLFENPYADEAAQDAVLEAPAHRELASDIAQRTAVLLKNDGALPLDDVGPRVDRRDRPARRRASATSSARGSSTTAPKRP